MGLRFRVLDLEREYWAYFLGVADARNDAL